MSLHDTSRQLTSYRNVEAWWARVEARAFSVRRARDRSDKASRRTERWRSQAPPIAAAGLGDRAVALIVPLLMTGIAAAELLLSRPIALWFTYEFLGEPTWAGVIAWLLPVALFALDIWLALLLDQNRREMADGGARNWPVVGLAVLVLTVLPAFTLANQLAILSEVEPEHLAMFWLRTMALVGVSLLLHAAVVLSGSFIRASLEYYTFLAGVARTTCAEAWCRHARDGAEQDGRTEVSTYFRLQHEHVGSWPHDAFRPFPPAVGDVLSIDRTQGPAPRLLSNIERIERGNADSGSDHDLHTKAADSSLAVTT